MSAWCSSKVVAFLMVVLMLSSGLLAVVPSWRNNVSATTIPSTFGTDWTVGGVTRYDGGNSVLTGNLTVQSGGNLVLNNLTLALANTFDGQFHIDIMAGGTFRLFNSTIQASGAFRMKWFHSNGTLEILGSVVRDFGLSKKIDGVSIMGGSAILRNDTFANNDVGLRIANIKATVDRCTILNSWDSGLVLNSTNLTVWGLTTFHNSVASGFGGSVWVGQGSVLTLHNSSISHNYGYGINVDGDTSATLYNSTNMDNKCGLYILCDYYMGGFGTHANLTYYNTPHLGGMLLGSGMHITTYWYVNISATWESDGQPAPGANYRLYNKTGVKAADGVLDGNGVRRFLAVRESVLSPNEANDNPYTFNVTGLRDGKARYDTYDSKVNMSKDLNFVLDDMPPKLVIISPVNGTATNLTLIEIKALTDLGAKGFINGTAAAVDNLGDFKAKVSLLVEGPNLIPVKAQDEQGNERVVVLNITRDTTPPALELTSPVSGEYYNSTAVRVSGSTEPGASVKMNGAITPILFDGTFNVSLVMVDGPNTLRVSSTDKVGNSASVSVSFTVDIILPYLNVAEPKDWAGTRNATVRVSGTTEAGAAVTVNGKTVVVTGTIFNTTVDLTEGSNIIVVKACDEAFNCVQRTLHVTKDTIAPKLVVSAPPDTGAVLTNQNQFAIKGSTDLGAKLKVNGLSTAVTMSGNFSQMVGLIEGLNNITITAEDAVGNIAQIYRLIMRDTIAPSINITSPKTGFRTKDGQVVVQGTVEAGASLSAGGQPVSYTGTNFTATVLLVKEGQNSITCSAKDLAGNVKSMTIIVEKDTQVKLLINSPASGYSTKGKTVSVTGYTDSKATVNINGKDFAADSAGRFSADVGLKVGKNDLVVKATDDLGNTNTTTVNVDRQKVASGLLAGVGLWIVLVVIIIVIAVVISIIMLRKKKKKDPMPGDSAAMLDSEP
jgi:hypothetical protein